MSLEHYYYVIIYYENRTRGTQEIIKLDITESLRTKQKVHSAKMSTKNPKVWKNSQVIMYLKLLLLLYIMKHGADKLQKYE